MKRSITDRNFRKLRASVKDFRLARQWKTKERQ